MSTALDPRRYEDWYHTPRGDWIARRELRLMLRLLAANPGASLLDVGSGTGYFTRRFAECGFVVTGLDIDAAMLTYARSRGGRMSYVRGTATVLPFADATFDYATAVTSLCFIDDPTTALAELWRVTRFGVVLGLLNAHSLLLREKHGRGGYAGARWDTPAAVRDWAARLRPPARLSVRSAVFLPGGGVAARTLETLVPSVIPLGGFLAVALHRTRPSGRP